MTGGGCGQMPCDEVLARLWAYIDGELTEETTAELREHLELCECCFPQYDFQQAFLALLRRHCREPMPAVARRAVFERLLREAKGV